MHIGINQKYNFKKKELLVIIANHKNKSEQKLQ